MKILTAEQQDAIFFALTDNSLSSDEIKEEISKVTNTSVKFVDEKIDDGCDDNSSDDYVMQASYKADEYDGYIDVYYGNNTRIIGYVAFTE